MRTSIGGKVAFGLASTVAVPVFIALASYLNTMALIQKSTSVTHTHTVLEEIESLLSLVKDVETGARGFFITGDEPFLERSRSAQRVLSRDFKILRELTANDERQQENLDSLEPLIAEKIDVVNRYVALRRSEGSGAARAPALVRRGKEIMDHIRGVVREMMDREEGLLKSRDQEVETSARRATQICILGCTVSFLLAVWSAALIRRDVVQRWRAADALRESEERMARIVETNAEGIFIVDREGRITFANATAETLLGLSRQAITDRTHNDPAWKLTTVEGKPFPDEDLPFNRVMRTGEAAYGVEVGVARPDGRRIVVSVNAAPLRDAAGAVVGMVSSVCDVTNRKELERLKDEFVSTVSHELRTPLTSLRGFAELMLGRDFPPAKQREFLTIIRNESVRLTTLINDFLDIQRMESGHQRYSFEVVDLVPLLREAIALFSDNEGKHRVQLDLPEALPRVWAAPDRLRQVLSNLLSNAIKFSPASTTVTVGALSKDTNVELWVADQGIGIEADHLPKLFTKFFRVDNKATRDIGGTGLGLALVKEIVEAHGGRVRVESEPDKGSTFFFSLPVAQGSPSSTSVPQARFQGSVDVLLVEDDESFARLLSEHFEAAGLSVVRRSKGEEALEMAYATSPRLAIVDIHLAGGSSGWDFLMAMKCHPTLRSVPVLIISASETINARGLALGGADYLLKPVSPQWLLEAIRRQLLTLSGKRVLIVDDDPAFRRQTAECLLAEDDLQVEAAANGSEALARMEQVMPDLLLLDLLMPDLDGFEVLQRLRADKRAVNLPVIVVTGKDLSPEDKSYIRRRMATLVRKREICMDHIAKAADLALKSGLLDKETDYAANAP